MIDRKRSALFSACRIVLVFPLSLVLFFTIFYFFYRAIFVKTEHDFDWLFLFLAIGGTGM